MGELYLTISLPYISSQVPVLGGQGELKAVSLLPNDVRRSSYGSPYRRKLIATAESQLFIDAFLLTRGAMGQSGKRPGGRLQVDVICRRPYVRRSDADNLVASLKSALDGIALALGIDDSRFQIGEVSWEQGMAATVVSLREVPE